MEIHIHREFQVTGRGTVIEAIVISGEIQINDILPYKRSLWLVRGLEYSRNGFGEIRQPIGIIIREINLEEENV
jgi:transposase